MNADPRRAIAGPAHHIYHEATACSTVSLPGRGFIVSDSLSETPVPSPPLGSEPASQPEAGGASPRRGRLLLRLLLLTALTTALVWFWDPLIVQYRQARARMSLDKRREAETLDSLRTALRRDLDNPHTLLWLARTHRRLGDLPRTSLLLDRAETLGGDARRIELERRLVLAQSGRLGEVEPLLPDMLIDAGADGPDVCEAFVQGFFVNLRTAEALRLLDLWQESFPKDPQPYFMRAYLMRSLDKYTEAEQIYRQGLALAPDRTAMRRELADILVVTNQLDQAESELTQCLQEAPDDPQVYFGLARCAYQRGNLAEVPPRLEETLQRAPDHYEARRLRGQLKLAEGQAAEALPDLEAVVAERPYDTLARDALGRTLSALGAPTRPSRTWISWSRRASNSAVWIASFANRWSDPTTPSCGTRSGPFCWSTGRPTTRPAGYVPPWSCSPITPARIGHWPSTTKHVEMRPARPSTACVPMRTNASHDHPPLSEAFRHHAGGRRQPGIRRGAGRL